MRELVYTCAASRPNEQADRIREANILFRLAPAELGFSLPDERRLEAMLKVGANVSAALTLLGRETGFMVSHGPSGSNLATVILPGSSQDFTAKGKTTALALVEAQASAMLAEADHASDGESRARRKTKPETTKRLW